MSEDLVRMVNQIATFFEPYPEQEAIEETQGHIQSFWTPQMRSDLRDYVQAGGKGLSKIGYAAARLVTHPQSRASE